MWNSQSLTPIHKYKRHKRQTLGLPGGRGGCPSELPEDDPHNCSPHLPLHQHDTMQKSQLNPSNQKCHRHKSHHEDSTGTNIRAAAGMRWRPRGASAPPLQPGWRTAEAGMHEEGSQCSSRRSEPETNAATDWQWREFYYYPIITLGSEPKWSMLPLWCHFLLSWLETKSGSMGAIMYDVTSIIATASPPLSVCLKHTERSILPKNG